MTSHYFSPDQWATFVVLVVLGFMALCGILSAVANRGGRRG